MIKVNHTRPICIFYSSLALVVLYFFKIQSHKTCEKIRTVPVGKVLRGTWCNSILFLTFSFIDPKKDYYLWYGTWYWYTYCPPYKNENS